MVTKYVVKYPSATPIEIAVVPLTDAGEMTALS